MEIENKEDIGLEEEAQAGNTYISPLDVVLVQ